MGEGEAKRRAQETLAGGAPSEDRIALQIEVFSPGDLSDRVRLVAAREIIERLEQRLTPICGACEREFGYREMPAALYCTRPMFPKGEAFIFICGAICPQCASRPTDELMTAVVSYLRAVKPDITIVEAGAA